MTNFQKFMFYLMAVWAGVYLSGVVMAIFENVAISAVIRCIGFALSTFFAYVWSRDR